MEQAIAGLGGRGERLPQLGKLRKGGEKGDKRPGQDLTYFRAQFAAEFEDVAAWFDQTYGSEPNDLRVLLPFRTVRQNFVHGYYRFTSKGVMYHQCNGQIVRFAMHPGSGEVLVANGEDVKTGESVPCTLRENDDRRARCSPGGRLSVFLRDSGAFAVMKVLTGSINDIRALEALLGGYADVLDAMGRDAGLAGVPFILSRRDAKIWAPIGDGGRNIKITKNLLTITLDPEEGGEYLDALEMIGSPARLIEQSSRKGWEDDQAERLAEPDAEDWPEDLPAFGKWATVKGYGGGEIVAALDGLEPFDWIQRNHGGYVAAAKQIEATLRAPGE